MKLFRYQNFINESKNYIHSICRDYGIEEYYTTINDDGTIDYDGFVFLASKKLSDLPLKFRNVNSFNCAVNQLTSLEGSPRSVGGYFYCYRNQLESLSGISKYISKGIDIEINQLRDVQGIKDGWRGEVWIDENPVYQIFKLFPYKRWDELIEFLNEYEVIRDGKVVVLQALELVFHEMDLEVPEIEEIEGYEIQY